MVWGQGEQTEYGIGRRYRDGNSAHANTQPSSLDSRLIDKRNRCSSNSRLFVCRQDRHGTAITRTPAAAIIMIAAAAAVAAAAGAGTDEEENQQLLERRPVGHCHNDTSWPIW
jgi:hypothetical protein